ncbi:type 1 glutamine amidotransferase [Halococcoides cellulosivorans]|uniref:Glutamine amidotransferase domain-containing protein n=1 Tax=Halococcoides cellulosivorans TaxID=1679096 RepID=A0A2R4WXK6_9EURY|nr:type 1 glutamine amidotransferase [Halococcoides cellulosivorans]AWB26268.1 hypothetical protein HARCEL1_00310 [Halococcoides cellulosivorans]
MTTPRVALVDASLGSTPAERNFRREIDLPIRVWPVSEGDLPPPVEDWDGDAVVVSGSQTAVDDDRAWIDRTAAWVADAVARDVPVLGVCWGHQLLARALGGRVEPMGEYELGYTTIDRVATDPVLDLPDEFCAFESHSDRVVDLPPDAAVVATSDRSIQAFRAGSALGVQFHPEYDIETARWVVENKREELSDERVDALLAGITPERHAETQAAKQVFEGFEELVSRRA